MMWCWGDRVLTLAHCAMLAFTAREGLTQQADSSPRQGRWRGRPWLVCGKLDVRRAQPSLTTKGPLCCDCSAERCSPAESLKFWCRSGSRYLHNQPPVKPWMPSF